MRIGLLHNSILPAKTYGGIERIVMGLAHEYRRLGHEVILFCREGSPASDFAKVELPKSYDGESLDSLLPKGLDFLHAHQPLRQRPSLPFLVTIHGNGHASEKYFANTNFLSQSHARNHNGKYYIYNGVDPERYPFVSQKSNYLVFLARTTWRVKNLRTAISVARDCGLPLEIMGGNGLSRGRIHYHGLVDEAEKIQILAHAKALIYPTNWDEPCAAAPLEALACGTPVIASANGCMPELVRPQTGFTCANYNELIQAVRNIDSICPEACRQAVEGYFSLERMAGDYVKLYDRIMRHGDLDHHPHYNFDPQSVRLLFKPTLVNRTRLAVLGKI